MSRLYIYLNEENQLNESRILNVIKDFKNRSERQIISTLKDAWQRMVNMIKRQGKEKEALNIINKALKTNYRSLDQLNRINETSADPSKGGFVNWLKSIIFQGTIGASIFTSLQIFFSLDNLLSGVGDATDIKKMIVYAFLWTLLASKTYIDWKQGYQVDQKTKGEE